MTIPYKQYSDGREVCLETVAGKREYLRRTHDLSLRQDDCCAICYTPVRLERATQDHQAGRGFNSSHRDDRILVHEIWHNAMLCYRCNGLKGSRRFHWAGKLYLPVAYKSLADAIADGEKLLPPSEIPPWA